VTEKTLNKKILLSVKRLEVARERAWDNYVKQSDSATFFHLIGWKRVLEKTFGYRAYYIYAEESGNIRGILPLFVMKNLHLKTIICSVPFGVYGGVCADNDSISEALLEEAKKITRNEGAEYMELKNVKRVNNGLQRKDLYSTFVNELPQHKDDCLKHYPRKARAACRKAINSGLEIETGVHLLKECYDLFAISLRNLGSPTVPLSLFINIAKEFEENVTVLSVKHNKRTISSVLTFFFKDIAIPYYSGSLPGYLQYQPNNFMYLKLMEYAVEKGYRYFDFGRSKKDTGSYKFKELQGFKPTPLHYEYYLNRTDIMPNISPVNPKYRFAIEAWKRMPVGLTKIIGPTIVKYIGG
ncbi:MAG: FemAB family XrtA/PEP-CTERM system-associated protein, partial [Candidatus Omnitrophota bacterium]